MMSTIRNDLMTVYQNVIPKKGMVMDSKMINYWSSAIQKNEKNIQDFERFLLKSNDYMNAVKAVFIDYYSELLSYNSEETHKLYQELVNHYEGKTISAEQIRNFIINSSIFQKEYNEIIQRLFEAIHDETPSETDIQHLINNFRNSTDYDMDKLKEDISNIKNKNNIVDVSSSTDTFHISTENKQLNSTTISSKNVLDIIDNFETIFGRDMNVREYILYMPDLLDVDSDKLVAYIESLKKTYHHVFDSVKTMISSYLKQNITEQEFIKEYLSRISQEDFISSLEATIIDSDEYKTKMCQRINSLYQKMYDQPLTSNDELYIFSKIKNKKYSLDDENMNDELVHLKEENDDIIQHIFDVFISTFEREPDKIELYQYIDIYREKLNDESFEYIDEIITQQLYDSLEYHDVIKRKIKTIYSDIKKISILPSMIYTILHKVIEHPDKKMIDKHITDVVVSL